MSPAKRPHKPLDDAAAESDEDTDHERKSLESLSGETEDRETGEQRAIAQQSDRATPQKPREKLMSRLMATPEKEATVRITVDLPKSMHQKLSMLSARTGKKKAEIVRMLLDNVLNDDVLDEV
jgi:hypothetical protein